MKYIYFLITSMIVLTVIIAGILLKIGDDSVESEKVALRINGRTFSDEEMKSLLDEKPHDLTENQFIKILIDQELLVQEAMKQKIHEEPEFKKNIKNYYEHSLVSALLNRKDKEIKSGASDEEVRKLIDRMGSTVEIVTSFYRDYDSAMNSALPSDHKTSVIAFEDLSDTYKYHLAAIEPGQVTPPLQDEYGYMRLKLVYVKSSDQKNPERNVMRSVAEKIITDEKRKALIEGWQQELKNKAVIEFKESKQG